MTNIDIHRQHCLDLIKGVDPEWELYLASLINDTHVERELTIGPARPMIYQLRNPAVVILEEDGTETHATGCVWLLNYVDGRRELVVPDETSGVLLERSTGRLISNFSNLPTPIPEGVTDLIRISIRVGLGENDRSLGWRLYSTSVSK